MDCNVCMIQVIDFDTGLNLLAEGMISPRQK